MDRSDFGCFVCTIASGPGCVSIEFAHVMREAVKCVVLESVLCNSNRAVYFRIRVNFPVNISSPISGKYSQDTVVLPSTVMYRMIQKMVTPIDAQRRVGTRICEEA